MRAWTGAGHLRLQRPLQPAALCQHLAAAGAAAASAGVDSRRRLGRDLAVVRRDGLRLRLPVLFRLQGRPGDDGRVLERDGAARQGPQSVPRRLPAIRRRRGNPREGAGSCIASPPNISTAAACTSIRCGRRRRATSPRRRSAPGIESQVGRAAAQRRAGRGMRRDRDEGHRRSGLRDHRLARRGGGAAAPKWRPS